MPWKVSVTTAQGACFCKWKKHNTFYSLQYKYGALDIVIHLRTNWFPAHSLSPEVYCIFIVSMHKRVLDKIMRGPWDAHKSSISTWTFLTSPRNGKLCSYIAAPFNCNCLSMSPSLRKLFHSNMDKDTYE